MADIDPRLLLLDERDNVLVVRKSIRAGETVAVAAARVRVDRRPAARPQARAPRHRRRGEGGEVRRADRLGHRGDRAWASTSTCTTSTATTRRPITSTTPAPLRRRAMSRGLSARRRPQGHPQRRRRRLPGGMRASRRPRDRHPVPRPRRAPHRLSRLLSQRLRRAMMQRLCTHPNVGAVLLVSLGCESFNKDGLEDTVRATGRPVKPIVIQAAGGTRRSVDEGRAWVAAERAALDAMVPRADGAWTSWWSARSAAARTPPAASPPTRRWAAPSTSGRGRRRLHLRGDRRADRLEEIMAERARHPGARRGDQQQRRQGGALLRDARPRLVRARQRRRRAHRPSRRSRSAPTPSAAARRSPGLIKPGRHPARGRALPARRGPRRRGALRLSQHQRQRRDRRADRLRQPRRPVLHRARLGRRLGDLAGDQGLRQPGDLPAHGRRHGRGRRPHPRGARDARRGRRARSTTWCWGSAAGRRTKSEALGHQEFILTYKSFEPIGPACLPAA